MPSDIEPRHLDVVRAMPTSPAWLSGAAMIYRKILESPVRVPCRSSCGVADHPETAASVVATAAAPRTIGIVHLTRTRHRRRPMGVLGGHGTPMRRRPSSPAQSKARTRPGRAGIPARA
jgi:hypothetical protein